MIEIFPMTSSEEKTMIVICDQALFRRAAAFDEPALTRSMACTIDRTS